MDQSKNDIAEMKLKIYLQPDRGPDSSTHQAVVNMLNVTLADEVILSFKTRGAYWNVIGSSIYDRHNLFVNQAKQLSDIADDISKRIRLLGGVTIASFEEILQHKRLVERPRAIPDTMELLADHEAVIQFLQEDAKKCSDEFEDEVTRDFLIEIQNRHEQMAGNIRPHIEPELSGDEGTTN